MQGQGEAMARLQGVRKRYGALQALDGVDLVLRGGELLALLGPNGAGKTTAIGLLLGRGVWIVTATPRHAAAASTSTKGKVG